MLKIDPKQNPGINKVEKDPFDIDVRELRTTSIKKEQTEEATITFTAIPVAITISITKYSLLLQC